MTLVILGPEIKHAEREEFLGGFRWVSVGRRVIKCYKTEGAVGSLNIIDNIIDCSTFGKCTFNHNTFNCQCLLLDGGSWTWSGVHGSIYILQVMTNTGVTCWCWSPMLLEVFCCPLQTTLTCTDTAAGPVRPLISQHFISVTATQWFPPCPPPLRHQTSHLSSSSKRQATCHQQDFCRVDVIRSLLGWYLNASLYNTHCGSSIQQL